MSVWLWIALGAVGLALVRLFAEYATRGDGDRVPLAADGAASVSGASVDVVEAGQCPHCGTKNDPDPAFTYCRDCTRQL